MTRTMDTDAYLTDIVRPGIRKHGWMVQYVGATADIPGFDPFAYTVGLTEAGLPELLVTGLGPESSSIVLNAAARASAENEFEPGEYRAGVISFPLFVVAADPKHAIMARNNYPSRKVRLTQLVWPDNNGFYPADALFSRRSKQPIYAL